MFAAMGMGVGASRADALANTVVTSACPDAPGLAALTAVILGTGLEAPDGILYNAASFRASTGPGNEAQWRRRAGHRLPLG